MAFREILLNVCNSEIKECSSNFKSWIFYKYTIKNKNKYSEIYFISLCIRKARENRDIFFFVNLFLCSITKSLFFIFWKNTCHSNQTTSQSARSHSYLSFRTALLSAVLYYIYTYNCHKPSSFPCDSAVCGVVWTFRKGLYPFANCGFKNFICFFFFILHDGATGFTYTYIFGFFSSLKCGLLTLLIFISIFFYFIPFFPFFPFFKFLLPLLLIIYLMFAFVFHTQRAKNISNEFQLQRCCNFFPIFFLQKTRNV